MNRNLLPYDVYERHKKIGSLIKNSETVLDVGGELEHLSQFCNPKKIIVANLTSGDVIISKNKIPFKENSFDIVCSIDVLEHIPKDKRNTFINDLVKVASKKVIISFPVGTKKHVEYENETEKWLENKGESVTYLKEHIFYGLPQKNEIDKITQNSKTKISYSGNLYFNKFLFKLFMFDPKIKLIRKLVYFLKLTFNLLTNPIIYQMIASKKFSENINRAYLTIYVNKP
jgi:ubiquinone/menaquinone biosynthesis C-methylase UbiE